MTRLNHFSRTFSAVAIAVALAAAGSAAFAQQGKGKGKPPNGETATNNLSYPALDLDPTTAAVGFGFSIANNPLPALGQTFSYGCNKEETIGTKTYPNTSCVSVTGTSLTYLTAEQCGSTLCAGETVEKIFWQKVPANDWSSDSRKLLTGEGFPAYASHVDWGDNLESRTWPSTSVLRVEVTPYADRGALEPLYNGLQMWHVYGQGQTEVWGVRTTDGLAPYAYESPYAILRTLNARLNLTKIVLGPAPCPTGPHNPVRTDLVWTGSEWVDPTGATTTWELRDISFSAELNVGGKWVYGYNWQLRRDGVPTGISKAGWWRLTYYTGGDVGFTSDTLTSPPVIPGVPQPRYQQAFAQQYALMAKMGPGGGSGGGGGGAGGGGGGGGGGGEEGGAYVPVVNGLQHITYLDICLK